jgi:segregation and condensation protein B
MLKHHLPHRFVNQAWRREESASLHLRQFFLRGPATAPPLKHPVELGGDGVRTKKSARLEAVLFVSDGALSTRRLAQLAMLADSGEALQIIHELNAAYDREGSAFRIERAANGYLLLTRPEFSRWLSRLHQRQNEIKLSPPALETLTVIAYRQPVTRADIEALRGVQCAEMLKQLMERGLVRIAGEDNSLGRPYLYETTRKFLETFGLRSPEDLPMIDRLRVVSAMPSTAKTES